jgi:hypothetical protein
MIKRPTGEPIEVVITFMPGYPEYFARPSAQEAADKKAKERGLTASEVQLESVYPANRFLEGEGKAEGILAYRYTALAN